VRTLAPCTACGAVCCDCVRQPACYMAHPASEGMHALCATPPSANMVPVACLLLRRRAPVHSTLCATAALGSSVPEALYHCRHPSKAVLMVYEHGVESFVASQPRQHLVE
jgi:hypothetical protein